MLIEISEKQLTYILYEISSDRGKQDSDSRLRRLVANANIVIDDDMKVAKCEDGDVRKLLKTLEDVKANIQMHELSNI